VIGPLARSLDMLEGLGGVDVQPAVRAAYEKACILLDLPIEHLRLADGLSDIRMAGFGMAELWLIDNLSDLTPTARHIQLLMIMALTSPPNPPPAAPRNTPGLRATAARTPRARLPRQRRKA